MKSLTDAIFIILGDNCNLNCKYCIQHEVRNSIGSVEINPDIYNYIYKEAKRRTGSDEPLHVIFFGGEPLLYYKPMIEIAENLMLRHANIKFGITTNGKLLDMEKVNYFNKNNWRIGISWDGRNVLQTRGYDALKEKRAELLEINHLTIAGVLSAKNYPYEMLEDVSKFDSEWFQKHNKHVHWGILPIHPLTPGSKELFKDIDFQKVENQINQILKESISTRNEYILPLELKTGLEMVGVHRPEEANKIAMCGVTNLRTVTLSLDGKLWLCSSCRELAGNIYDNRMNILKTLKKLDKTESNYLRKCKGCEVQPLCRGGCPLLNPKDHDAACSLKKALYRPFKSFHRLNIVENGIRTPVLVYLEEKNETK